MVPTGDGVCHHVKAPPMEVWDGLRKLIIFERKFDSGKFGTSFFLPFFWGVSRGPCAAMEQVSADLNVAMGNGHVE